MRACVRQTDYMSQNGQMDLMNSHMILLYCKMDWIIVVDWFISIDTTRNERFHFGTRVSKLRTVWPVRKNIENVSNISAVQTHTRSVWILWIAKHFTVKFIFFVHFFGVAWAVYTKRCQKKCSQDNVKTFFINWDWIFKRKMLPSIVCWNSTSKNNNKNFHFARKYCVFNKYIQFCVLIYLHHRYRSGSDTFFHSTFSVLFAFLFARECHGCLKRLGGKKGYKCITVHILRDCRSSCSSPLVLLPIYSHTYFLCRNNLDYLHSKKAIRITFCN